MVIKNAIEEIASALRCLPPEKVAAVKDYVDFLKSRYENGPVDQSDEWTEDDLKDFAAASARYGETVAPWDESRERETDSDSQSK
jgi:hypothetical protein